MNTTDLTAVILAGGKGERLRPFTEHTPKPLVHLLGRPLLGHLIDYFLQAGIQRVVVCTGYKSELVHEYVAGLGIPELQCVDSGVEAPMCRRLLDAAPHVQQAALVCYGDTLANVDLAKLCEHHTQQRRLATVTTYPLKSSFGLVELDADDRVLRLSEKPVLPYWINIGFLVLERAALDLLQPEADLVQYLNQLSERQLLSGFRHSGRHLTINTEKERADAERQIKFFSVQEGPET